jgi:hypothetical protein
MDVTFMLIICICIITQIQAASSASTWIEPLVSTWIVAAVVVFASALSATIPILDLPGYCSFLFLILWESVEIHFQRLVSKH